MWNELCRLYPTTYACGAYAGTFYGDTPEQDALDLAWFAVAAHGLLGRLQVAPDAWYADASDPAAASAFTAAMHFEAQTFVDGCADDVAGCLQGDLEVQVTRVLDKSERLTAGTCTAVDVRDSDGEAFVAQLSSRHPGWDWQAAQDAALAASGDLGAIVNAIETDAAVQLTCPKQELWDWYRLPCP